jgi:three-Cys-motif partner protein
MAKADDFFEEFREQSLIKAKIVRDYFWAWAKVIIAAQKRYGGADRIAYIDLFSGPGRDKAGTKSTPLLVLETAIADPEMRERLATIFNDKDSDHSRSLEEAIRSLPGVKTLKYEPLVMNEDVGTEVVKMFDNMNLVPTLFFVDPWGYRGLTLKLIDSVLKDWGCDCIVFFNYNRINMGLPNQAVEAHMNALFGEKRRDALRERLNGLNTADREIAIVEEIAEALKDLGGKYVLPFTFKTENGRRTSHHLIFVSKAFKGYEIMREIMARQSTTSDQGVPSFCYNPADGRFPMLFELARPLDDLLEMLRSDFAGKSLTVRQIYERHSIGKGYILKNYKDALRQLETTGKIQADPPAAKRPMRKGERTFADTVLVIFPKRKGS